jgi:hypothetical protein
LPRLQQAILTSFGALGSATPNEQAAQSAALKWISMLLNKCPERVTVFERKVCGTCAFCRPCCAVRICSAIPHGTLYMG